jgi:hypothetical protein
MLLIKNSSLFAFIFLLSGLFCLSCVDVPTNAPPPPVLNAEFRFISINPSSVAPVTQFKMAEATYIGTQGPNFTSYATIALGANAAPTAFTIYNAGSKYLVYLTDTLKSINFDTDEKTTLVFARNNVLSTDLTKAKYSVYKLTLGYRFSPVSYRDTTIVRFVNLMTGGQDTIGVRQDSSSNPSIVGTAIAIGKSSAFIKIPTGKKINYFFTLPTTSDRVCKDSLQIIGTSSKVKTVFIYDKYDTTSAVVDKTVNVKIKDLDEN